MKATFFVIAVLLNGSVQVESVYPMSGPLECEEVATHQAVLDSYPQRVLFCMTDDEEPQRPAPQALAAQE